MTDKTSLWDRLGKTDPKRTKSFQRAGGFKGTAINPMSSYRRMTEEYGPCGVGWGMEEPVFQTVPTPEGEVLVYCTVAIWHGDRNSAVYGVGGDKVVGKNRSGIFSDDEAFKKAFTDAVTNALKFIGVGADVHMGLFDDSKYVSELRQEFQAAEQADEPQAAEPEDDSRQQYIAACRSLIAGFPDNSTVALSWWNDPVNHRARNDMLLPPDRLELQALVKAKLPTREINEQARQGSSAV